MRTDRGETGGDTLGFAQGAVAQLVERLDGIQEVGDSSSPGSTYEALGFTLGGYVAGEGSFCVGASSRLHLDGAPLKKFVFSVQVQQADLPMLQALRAFLRVGSIRHVPKRKPTWEPTCIFSVRSLTAHWNATIPFADRYLLPCNKRVQFDKWRDELEAYVERHNVRCGRGRSTCSVHGCGKLVRGRGLCRSHYYRATGW